VQKSASLSRESYSNRFFIQRFFSSIAVFFSRYHNHSINTRRKTNYYKLHNLGINTKSALLFFYIMHVFFAVSEIHRRSRHDRFHKTRFLRRRDLSYYTVFHIYDVSAMLNRCFRCDDSFLFFFQNFHASACNRMSPHGFLAG